VRAAPGAARKCAPRSRRRCDRESLQFQSEPVERELKLLRQEFTVLREQVGIERGLKRLRKEVETARAQVPDLPAIEKRVNRDNVRLQAELAKVRGELVETKKRFDKLRVEQSVMGYKMEQELAASKVVPSTKMVLETSSTRFVMQNIHPEAAKTLRQFAAEVIDAQSGRGILFSGPAESQH
jgi:hypothetical protein